MPETLQSGESRRWVLALLGLGAFLLLFAVVAAVRTMSSISHDTDMVEHTQEVQNTLSQLAAQGERIETARRGYLIQPSSTFEAVVRRASQDFDVTEAKLRALVSDNPAQLRRLNDLQRLDSEKDAMLAALFASPDSMRRDIIGSNFDGERGVRITREIRALLREMSKVETDLLSLRNRSQLNSLVQFYTVGGFALAMLVVVMVGAVVLVMRYNADLSKAQAELHLANQGLEEIVTSRTAELRRANEEIQRFAYIVSHDLRSPLVNVLGFTSELDEARKNLQRYLRRFAEDRPEVIGTPPWLAVEEDIPEALGFIRASTEKMDRLINSILELSRQGRRTLTIENLDMTALAQSVADTLHQRTEQAGAKITLGDLPPLESDRMAVEQIVANLVENAIKYGQPGRPVEVRIEGRTVGGTVEIDIADNGRGIAPSDQERVFELFRRAGVQDQPGEGIGLANVRALAYRLGGKIMLSSEAGKGSVFTLVLPKKFVAAEVTP